MIIFWLSHASVIETFCTKASDVLVIEKHNIAHYLMIDHPHFTWDLGHFLIILTTTEQKNKEEALNVTVAAAATKCHVIEYTTCILWSHNPWPH